MANKLDLVFKKIINRQYTSAIKAWYEENPGVPFKLKGSNVWVSDIPSTPPVSSTSVVEVYGASTEVVVVKDDTVNDNKAHKAYVGNNPANDRLTGFISPIYGQGYTARLFDNDGTTEIFTTDSVGWFFDYEAGILTFDNDPEVAYNGPFKLRVYRYTGKTVDDFKANIDDSVWQEPIAAIANTPATSNPGDRFIVGAIPAGDFSTFSENDIAQCQAAGEWTIVTPKAGMITYDVTQEKLLLYDNNDGWSYSGIDAIDLDYSTSDSDLNATTVKDAIDEIDDLIKLVTKDIFVDNKRTDTYTATGSRTKPFKTFTAAVSAAETATKSVIHLATSDVDYVTGGTTLDANISVVGESRNTCTLAGDITLNKGSFKNINFTGTVTFTGSADVSNCALAGVAIQSNVIFTGSDIIGSNTGAPVFSITAGRAIVNAAEISNDDGNAISQATGGMLILNGCVVSGGDATAVIQSTGGIARIYSTVVENTSTATVAISINNGATATTANIISDVFTRLNIVCNDSITHIEGVVGIESSNISGTAVIYRGSDQIRNTSSLIKDAAGGSTLTGQSVESTINRVAQTVQYHPVLENLILDPCIDNVA